MATTKVRGRVGACPGGTAARKLERTVYVVDDDPSFRRAAVRLLEATGYDARAFDSVTAFMASLPERDHAACVLSDMRMPGHNGLDLQRILREAGRDVPMVFVTAYEDPSAAERAEAGGAIRVLAKPVGKEDLLEAIEEALGVAP